jgi:CBS domain containing-hemolysin-like protein
MALLLAYVGLALVVSFFCSIFESVLLSVTPSYIEHLKQSAPLTSERLQAQKDHIDSPLVAILTFNTLAHTAGAAGAGVQATHVFGNEALGVFSAILTFMILFFSEIIPKTLGARFWRQLAPSVSWSISGMETLAKPFIWIILRMTSPLGKHKTAHYIRQEMSAMAALGRASGELEEQESTMLAQMLKVKNMQVQSVMTPRTVMFTVDETMTCDQFVTKYAQTPFSRVLIYRDKVDNIIGYVFRNEILIAEKKSPEVSLATLKKPLTVLPETATILNSLKILMQQKVQIALVVNEYGSPLGLLTMEDLIESLLGMEIVDITDPVVNMQHLARSMWEQRIQEKGIMLSEDNPKDHEKKPTKKNK